MGIVISPVVRRPPTLVRQPASRYSPRLQLEFPVRSENFSITRDSQNTFMGRCSPSPSHSPRSSRSVGRSLGCSIPCDAEGTGGHYYGLHRARRLEQLPDGLRGERLRLMLISVFSSRPVLSRMLTNCIVHFQVVHFWRISIRRVCSPRRPFSMRSRCLG